MIKVNLFFTMRKSVKIFRGNVRIFGNVLPMRWCVNRLE